MNILKYTIKFFVFIIAALLLNSPLNGQSVYSSGGIGELYWFSNSRALGMGNSGIASRLGKEPSRLNPALWVGMEMSNIGGGFLMQGVTVNQGDASFKDDASTFSGISCVIKIGKRNGLGFGLIPYSKMNYRMTIFENDLNVYRSNTGKGGISQAYIGWSVKPAKVFNIGLTYNYFFGNIDEAWQVDYVSNEYKDTDEHLISTYYGTGINAGFTFNPGKLLQVGAVFQKSVELTMRDKIRETDRNETEIRTGKLSLPYTAAFGISIIPHQKWEITGDLVYRNTSELKYNSVPINNVENEVLYGIGTEFRSSEKFSDSFFKRGLYRLGFYTKNLYLKDIDGSSIRETFVTFGMGVPYFFNFGMIDISFQFGTRGDKNSDFAGEKIGRIGISFSGRERWFVRRQ